MHNIDKWVDQLVQDNSSLMLVEGRNDIKTLNKLGINNVSSIDKPIYLIIENITKKNKKVIILTDFDFEGVKLHNKIKHKLNRKFLHFINNSLIFSMYSAILLP
jgi:5S rRNA maturation endonuclease (ribonuclease M5)